MPYELELADRLREALADEDGIIEKGMFGGRAFLLNGNMAISASGRGGLMVRVGVEQVEDALSRPHTKQIEMRGRPMRGWIHVAPEGARNQRQVATWVRRALVCTRALPPKR